MCAHGGNDDGDDEKSNRDDGEGCKHSPRILVVFRACIIDVHSNELEEEVGHCAKVDDLLESEPHALDLQRYTYYGRDHANHVLLPGPVGSQEQYEDRDGNGSASQTALGLLGASHDDQKLDSKAEKEEKIEFQQCDVNLDSQLAPLAQRDA